MRFFGVAVLWCLAAMIVCAEAAHHSEWRDDVTLIGMLVWLLVAGVAFAARTIKWRGVRARVQFLSPESQRRSTPKGTAALTPLS